MQSSCRHLKYTTLVAPKVVGTSCVNSPQPCCIYSSHIITILGFITITASAEFDFDVGYEEFVRINPDKTFLESEIGLYVGWTEGGQRQITTIPHNSALAASLQE
ncbi:BAH_G0017730.mRNA.1.CDS.1 [Saccharomyces cerevisiae]|nr:BAH_G0017730.mRNA.1.CDS.1 [Saccharomyces cerevisiae]CAI7117563.1 BAH_G0017730.mRNA.1.CDS.1 [Saccharomyces cerevisiae]